MFTIEIIKGNIVDCDAEAIVNAANSDLYGGGVCGAIFQTAGYDKMEDACIKIGHCDTGNAVITDGFNLKARYVIHAVGPIYSDYSRTNGYTLDEVKKIGLENIIINEKMTNKQLHDAYTNSLKLAEEHNIKSIAFPTLSAGIYGYPLDLATRIEIEAIKEYQKNSPYSCINKVVVCAFVDEIYDMLVKSYNEK